MTRRRAHARPKWRLNDRPGSWRHRHRDGRRVGIGRAIALALAAEGAPVAVLDLQPKGGQETVGLIEAAGGKATFVPVDVRNWDDVDRAFFEAVAALGPLGIVVNAAGILDGYAQADAVSPVVWERVIGINLTGTFWACKRALTELLPRGGRIVNIASTAGLVGDGGGPAYVASKHGVVGLPASLPSSTPTAG